MGESSAIIEIQNFWNSRYANEGYIWGKNPSKCYQITKDHLEKNSVKKILDLGCGYGRDVIHLFKSGFDVSGIDVAENGILLAQKWAEEENIQPYFKKMDATNLEFPDNHFDAIISNRFLHLLLHLENKEKSIREIHRILKNDGLLSIAVRGFNDPSLENGKETGGGGVELAFRPGHKIKFLTPVELYTLFENKFEIDSIKEISEAESKGKNIDTILLHVIARKIGD